MYRSTTTTPNEPLLAAARASLWVVATVTSSPDAPTARANDRQTFSSSSTKSTRVGKSMLVPPSEMAVASGFVTMSSPVPQSA